MEIQFGDAVNPSSEINSFSSGWGLARAASCGLRFNVAEKIIYIYNDNS